MSFRSRLIFGLAIIQITIWIAYITINFNSSKNDSINELTSNVEHVTSLLANIFETAVISSDIATIEEAAKEVSLRDNIKYIKITDSIGETLYEQDLRPKTPPSARDLLMSSSAIGGREFTAGHIIVGFSKTAIDKNLETLLSNQIEIALTGFFAVILTAYALVTLLSRRLTLLEQGALQIQKGELGFQIEAKGNDEIGKTANAFNTMSQHIDNLYTEQQRVNNLLTILNNAQKRYIESDNPNAIFDNLLEDILHITQSAFGFIGEVTYTDDNTPYLHTFSLTNISWDDDSKALYEENKVSGFKFYNLDTLFGAAIKTGLPVIANDAKSDNRASGIPKGHPKLDSFLGMPLYNGDSLIGLIGLANRNTGYNQNLIEELNALWQVSASILASFRNEQERNNIENELRQSEERFSLVAQGTNDGMWDWDLTTGKIFYSDRWREMLGYNNQDITDEFIEWQSLLHPNDLGEALDTWTDCMDAKLKTFSIKYRLQHKDGDYRWILCRGTVFTDSIGNAIRMAGSHTDITKQMENEFALEESAKRTQAILDNVSEAIITLNSDGFIEECNPAISDIFGYSMDEVLGRNIKELVKLPDLVNGNIEALKRICLLENETTAVRKDKNTITVDFEISELNDEKDEQHLICVVRDITARKKAEDAIRKAHEAAVDAAKTKSEFLANMSHEIRTPLHGILGMLQLTEKTKLDEKQTNYISTATKSANHLLEIINDILDFSKIEAGKLDLEYVPLNLRELLEDVTRLYAQQAQEKGIVLEQVMAADLPDSFYGDPARLKQIFNNLVSFPLLFTTHGSVLIKVKQLSQLQDEATLKIEVVDTGIGISKEAQEKIFSSFQQADNTMARKYGGTGLGLAICKQLTDLMNGNLTIESKEGKGSRFIFTITLRTIENQNPYDEGPLVGKRVLTLDTTQQESITNEIIADFLEHWRLENTIIDSIDDIEGIRQLEDRIDYLFVYAKQVGFTSLSKLRSILGDKTHFIIISNTNAQDSLAVNNSAILEMPIKQSEIYNSLVGFIAEELKVNSRTRSSDLDSVSFSGNILLVEDNPVNQEVSGEILRQLGLKVDIRENGIEAVKAINNHAYDLVLMDCQMPEMDGFEATVEIRGMEEKEKRKRLPIIALTANAMKGDKEKCIAVGMDDYLSKPFTNKTLINTLTRWLTMQDETTNETHSRGSKDNFMEDRADDDQIEVLNHDMVNNLKKIMKDRFATMVDKFETNAKKLLREMNESFASKDQDTLRRAAHTLKGSSGTLGAIRLQDACLALENVAQLGDFDQAENLIRVVELEYQAFEKYLPELKVA